MNEETKNKIENASLAVEKILPGKIKHYECPTRRLAFIKGANLGYSICAEEKDAEIAKLKSYNDQNDLYIEAQGKEIAALKEQFRSAKNVGCDATCLNYRDGDEQTAKLEYDLISARREIEVLRRYGNKDCTAMADEELENIRSMPGNLASPHVLPETGCLYAGHSWTADGGDVVFCRNCGVRK